MVPYHRKTLTFYRITGVPAPAAHEGAMRLLSLFFDRLAARIRRAPPGAGGVRVRRRRG